MEAEVKNLPPYTPLPKSPFEGESGGLNVIRRNGKVTGFDPTKISVAMTKAFLAVEGDNAATSSRIHETVQTLTAQVTNTLSRHGGGTVHIEDIQDQVEQALMRTGEHKVARDYVLYREQRAQQRATQASASQTTTTSELRMTCQDGTLRPINQARLATLIQEACQGLDEVQPEPILLQSLHNLFDGVAEEDINQALVMSARTLIEKNPNHSFVAARLLLDKLRSEALGFLKQADLQATSSEMGALYGHYFDHYIRRGIDLELLDPTLLQYNLKVLGQSLQTENDLNFTYLGLQTLYDRYFIHSEGIRFELPQAFFMRVAMGLAINEADREACAIEFYKLLSNFDFMSSTPTLFNSGTLRPQLSSCYLTTIPDDLEGIFSAIKDDALLSKFAGGLGNDWTPVRGMGSHIKGTNGKSQGVVPFMKVANDTAVAVNQGGKRKGAMCAYLEIWHIDIEEFLELRKNTGDERRRTHDMNTANWVPDLFMKRIHMEEGTWTLFSPDETPDLHELHGAEFEQAYLAYEAKADCGGIKIWKRISAEHLWRKMLSMLFETGHPWITFKDPCNLRSPQSHSGVVHSSNLCTEITLNTSDQEIAVCNLGSVNLANHINQGGLDSAKLKKTIQTAMRMLDNVIDINYYSVPQARNSNLKHRPVGLGIMGFQDALYQLRIPYASEQAVSFADQSMEEVSYCVILSSTKLAKERGCYASYEGSLWQQGILPIDSIEILENARNGFLKQDRSKILDWDSLRQIVQKNGMRNSNCMAIAPTATISNICGVSQSIEPTYQNLFVKSNLSGEFTVVNHYLINDLKRIGVWDAVMANDLKYFDGSVQNIERIPKELKALYATAFEIDSRWLVEAASRRQKWIDQAQSLNLYMAEPSGKKLDILYKLAWVRGLKTTYYLRSMGATHAEKSTITDGKLNAVSPGLATYTASSRTAIAVPKACSILDPECEACQ